ncbi:SRPBCC family protein [Nocardioides taihuensis]|uniref:SRPBCC domain-containing protein n=1 Tax=Nocardioides taihuensis TaxID=1835606 RepID=A0ABW0BGU4_9ACTN
MGVFVYSVWIDAAPEKVWGTYVDPARVADWQTGKPVVGDVQGAPGEAGSTYVSRRGPFAARTTVLAAEVPRELVTRTDAYFGLQFELTSRLEERSGGTELQLRAATHWRRRLGPVGKVVELAVLSPREARKELAMLKALIEREASN